MSIHNEFKLTLHAQDRLYERFPEIVKPIYDSTTNPAYRVKKLYDLFRQSVEDKRLFNDHEFMIFVYEKYGYDTRYKFFVLGKILFIGVFSTNLKNEKWSIVTVIDRSKHFSSQVKFTPVQKKPKANTFVIDRKPASSSKGFKRIKREYMENDLCHYTG